jgi:C4-dicarboxylate-binding protein DctP
MRAFWWCLWAALGLMASGAAASRPITIRATVQNPVTEPFLGASLGLFKEEVERETENEIVIEIYDRGKLYIDDQVVDAVRSGAIEMGVAGLNQINRALPGVGVMEQPFLFNFEGLVQAATGPDSALRKQIDDAVLATMGLRVLWWQTFGNMVFFTKDIDVSDPRRIKDQKIRTFSEATSHFAKECGGIPVMLSAADVQQALSDGRLDMVMTGPGLVQTRDLWKWTTAITRTNHAAIEFVVVINEKTWQSLVDRHRSILLQAARRADGITRERSSALEAAAYAFARSKGMKVYELAPNDIAEWRACSSDVLVDYMSKGGELSRRLLSAYGKLRTQPCCSAGPQRSFTDKQGG